MRRGVGNLYHLAEGSNLASILQHGLMSTERLLDLACVAKPERDALLRVHRPDNIQLSDSVVIRDQRPMPLPPLGAHWMVGLSRPIGTRS